jgi:hypothetical protein
MWISLRGRGVRLRGRLAAVGKHYRASPSGGALRIGRGRTSFHLSHFTTKIIGTNLLRTGDAEVVVDDLNGQAERGCDLGHLLALPIELRNLLGLSQCDRV